MFQYMPFIFVITVITFLTLWMYFAHRESMEEIKNRCKHEFEIVEKKKFHKPWDVKSGVHIISRCTKCGEIREETFVVEGSYDED